MTLSVDLPRLDDDEGKTTLNCFFGCIKSRVEKIHVDISERQLHLVKYHNQQQLQHYRSIRVAIYYFLNGIFKKDDKAGPSRGTESCAVSYQLIVQ